MTDILLREQNEQGILRLTLNDAGRRNALSEAMLGALLDAVTAAGEDPSVRVVILAALGPAFSAGHDLKEMIQMAKEDEKALTKVLRLLCWVLLVAGWMMLFIERARMATLKL